MRREQPLHLSKEGSVSLSGYAFLCDSDRFGLIISSPMLLYDAARSMLRKPVPAHDLVLLHARRPNFS